MKKTVIISFNEPDIEPYTIKHRTKTLFKLGLNIQYEPICLVNQPYTLTCRGLVT